MIGTYGAVLRVPPGELRYGTTAKWEPAVPCLVANLQGNAGINGLFATDDRG